ncbi:peptidoglycan-binding domain-containing protein [Streptomyces asoensis]
MPTPDEPGQPHERPVLEPIRVLRPRNTDALAELFREMTELTQDPDAYESIPLAAVGEAETEELPPLDPRGTDPAVPAAPRASTAPAASASPVESPVRPSPPLPYGGRDWSSEHRDPRPAPGSGAGTGTAGAGRAARRRGAGSGTPVASGAVTRVRGDSSGAGLRRGAIAVGVCAAALAGFAGALLLPGRGGEAAAAQTPPATAPAPDPTPSASADPEGAGTLREGDSGAEVADLQERLLRIPDVYAHGATDGRYDTVLTEAVARFQLWYGIRGDESGVYGDDTRRDLESRTATAG